LRAQHPEHPLDPSLANKIKDVVRAEDALREQFSPKDLLILDPRSAIWSHDGCIA